MPGIYEATSETVSESVPSETPVQSETMNEPVEQSTSSNAESDDQQNPPREIDQTDKINKFLLKSFLQHINNDPVDQSEEPAEQNVDESDGEWE